MRRRIRMYRQILFDLDGTLSDPKIGICTSVQYALSRMGIEEPDLDRLEPFIGPPLTDSFSEFYGMSEPEAKQAVQYYRERFSVIGKYENELYPGIYELLSDLKADKRFVGIASSKPTVFVEDILAYFRIRPFFDVVCGSELNGTKNKKEEVLEEALQMLFGKSGIGREDTVMVGDRKFDVEAADKLGVAGIAVSYGYGSVEELTKAGAKMIVSSVQELKEKLL